MKAKALIFEALLLIVTISFFSCAKNNIPEDIMVKGGKGTPTIIYSYIFQTMYMVRGQPSNYLRGRMKILLLSFH